MGIAIAIGLDIIVAAILVISIVSGVKRGLVKSLISLVGNIAALVVALIFSVQLGTYLNDHYIRTPLYDWTVNQLTSDPDNSDTSIEDVDMEDLFENRPEFFTNLCEYMNIDIDEMNQRYEEFRANGEEQAKSAVIDVMVEPISNAVSRVIAFIIIYILALIAVKLITLVSHVITKLPIIRSFNKLGGGMIGVVIGILISFIFVSMVHLSSPYILRNMPISERTQIFESTTIYKFVYKMNPLSLTFGEWFDNE